MLKIINIGMNHETAPVEMRECLVSEPEHTFKALANIRNLKSIREGLFLSTCNRVEVLFVTETAPEAKESVVSLLSELGNIPKEEFLPSLYVFEEAEAVRHVFRVASSLDSMVVGEPQILGQIKDAYAEANKEKTSGVILNRLMHRAFHAAKRVRTETQICDAAVSISYAAVELAKKIFHELKGKHVLLVGAGEMAELAARHLIAQGVDSMVVANRTFHRAVQVAEQFGARPVSFDEIAAQLKEVDIVVSSTASPEYIITYEEVKNALRKRRNRPLFLIDIAVPKDVQPQVNDLNNVYLYDIDDLKGIIELNREQRRQEAIRAERIVEEEVLKFQRWLKTLAVVPTIVALREKVETIVAKEINKSRSVLASMTPAQREGVQTLVRSVTEKVLNDPIVYLKGKAERPTVNSYLDVTKKLFNLDRDRDEMALKERRKGGRHEFEHHDPES